MGNLFLKASVFFPATNSQGLRREGLVWLPVGIMGRFGYSKFSIIHCKEMVQMNFLTVKKLAFRFCFVFFFK